MSREISKKEVEHIAHLARIQLSSDELVEFQKQLSSIMEYAGMLAEIDVSGIDSTTQTTEIFNAWREDNVQESLPVETALSQASSRQDNFFKVKKVLGES